MWAFYEKKYDWVLVSKTNLAYEPIRPDKVIPLPNMVNVQLWFIDFWQKVI